MISERYLLFDEELHEIVEYSKANQERLAISPKILNRLEIDWQTWTKTFKLYIDNSRRTTDITHQVGTNYAAITKYLRRFKNMIKNNLDIELSEADYTGLHIHKRKPRRSQIPKPTFAPQIMLLKTSHLRNKFVVREPRVSNQKRARFPTDVSGAGRKLAVMPTDKSPTAGDYKGLSTTTRTTFTLNFEPSQAGKKGYLIAWYVNRRGEMGPESEPLEFMII